ncbi:MAG: hypothetical protein ACI4RT_00915 [Candidatus Spyradenecus sp.]
MINLDALRNVNASRTLVLNRAGDDLIQNKSFQKFRSFFNIGSARAENRQTLDAIRTAILNDPHFNGSGDLAAQELDRLLGQVRTDRAIKAGQITSILSQMDAFVAQPRVQWRALHLRIEARLAATERPPALAQLTDAQYAEITKKVLCTSANGDPQSLDVPTAIAQLNEKLEALMPRINQTPFIRDILLGNVARHFMVSLDDLTAHIEGKIAAFENALGQLPEVPNAEEAGRYRECCIDLMRALEKPVDPRLFQVLKAFTDQLPVENLQALLHSPEPPTSDAILRTVGTFLDAAQDNTRLATFYPEGMEILNGGDESTTLSVFATYTALLRLPAADRAALHALLCSPAGQNVGKLFLTLNSNPLQQANANALAVLRQNLERFDNLQPVEPDPAPVDLSAFSAQTLTDLSPLDTCFTGTFASDLRKLLSNIPATIDTPEPTDLTQNPTAENFKRAVRPSVKTMVATSFAYDMKAALCGETTTFEKDIIRDMHVYLPDGTQLPADFNEARDRLAALVSGNPQATYAQAPEAIRHKVCFITALLSQEVEKVCYMGMPIALNSEDSSTPFTAVSRYGEVTDRRAFHLALNDDGGVSVRYERHCPMMMLMRQGDRDFSRVSQDSYEAYSLSIDIPGNEVNRLLQADWQGADFSSLSNRLSNPKGPGDFGNIFYAVPASCRLDAQVDFGLHIHANAL